jgi:hypothetical protein
LVPAFLVPESGALPIFFSGQCTDSLLTKNGRFVGWRSSRNHQQLGQVICGQILTLQDKSTMNLFAIDSLRELREDKVGPN